MVVLYEYGVELPSDYKAVVYISLADDSRRCKLLQELRGGGLYFSLKTAADLGGNGPPSDSAAGVNAKTVQEFMGHSTISMTF